MPADQVSEAPKKKSAFSLGNIWRAVSFQGEEASETDPLVPEEVVQLGEVVQTIAKRAAELSSTDSPEVTRKKAFGILDSLKPWESLMAAGQSVGLIGGKTAGVLNSLVAKLKEKTQELVEHAPKPETIRAVKYLAGQLGLAYTNTVGLLNRKP